LPVFGLRHPRSRAHPIAGIDPASLVPRSPVTDRWASWQATISNVGTLKDQVDRRISEQIQGVDHRQPRDTRLRAVIRGTHHFTFSDEGRC